jgi:hypothetical protein
MVAGMDASRNDLIRTIVEAPSKPPGASSPRPERVESDAVEQAMATRATRPGTTLNRALATAANPVRAR